MNRRNFLTLLGTSGIGLTACAYLPDDGFFNPCLENIETTGLLEHELVKKAWFDIDPSLYRDCHVHLIGTGDNDSGIWINPDMKSLLHPVKYVQYMFYLDASCVNNNGANDNEYIKRLNTLMAAFPPGAKSQLLAFDYYYNDQGHPVKALSAFKTPNEYAAKIAANFPDRFEWTASIHPYRADAIERLEWAIKNGTQAVKWLPAAMNIDPSSPRCDRFYEALVKYNLPLLTHTGEEQAVDAEELQALGNPLLLRKPLDQGVKVIMAHCASIGTDIDIDKPANKKEVESIKLFARLMDDKNYEGLLFGDISAITQVNRTQKALEMIYTTDDWHHRLVQGSDYPLPGVMPLISLSSFTDRGYIKQKEADILSAIRRYNPLLFDFVLKRTITVNGKSLKPSIFESAKVFRESSESEDEHDEFC